MITTSDIYRAIHTRLETAFENENIQIKDFKNPVPPCFYIQYISSKDSDVTSDTKQTTTSFNIVYFSDDDTLLDLVEIETRLKAAFKKPLYVTDENNVFMQWLEIDNKTSTPNETDYILTYTLDFDFLQDAENDNPYDEYENNETMNELTVNNELLST